MMESRENFRHPYWDKLSEEEKNSISHRGHALRDMLSYLKTVNL